MASLDERVSRVQGVIERMNERLGNLEQGLHTVQTEMRSNFRWMLGTMLAMWVTVIGTVLGALIAG